MSEILILALVFGLPAMLAAMLPSKGRLALAFVGVIGAGLLLFVLPNGSADSPINILGAVVCIGFACGAGLTHIVKLFKAKSAAHG